MEEVRDGRAQAFREVHIQAADVIFHDDEEYNDFFEEVNFLVTLTSKIEEKKMRFKKLLALGIAMLLAAVSGAQAQNFKLGGVYNAWGYSQQKFFFGRFNEQDDYIVQMLRLNLSVSPVDNVKVFTRLDLAQGWWGVDNELPNGGSQSRLFDNKDTNFSLHVDQAYLWFNSPKLGAAFTVGRMPWMLGQRLLIDNNYDGVQVDINAGKHKLKVGWAKVSEGYDGLTDNSDQTPDLQGNTDGRDADLMLADFARAGEKNKWNLFGFFYKDRGIRDGSAFVIDGLQYNRPRFTPQVSELWGFGLTWDLKLGKINFSGEGDVLFGKDGIANSSFGGPLNVNRSTMDPLKYDINDGDLSGYNLLLKASRPGKLTPGLIFGLGSGDKAPSRGKGNVNKLRTAGFFYITEVWEDSVMPDEEGITPQGLGAPNTRGYRELENTTIIQANAIYKFSPKVSLFGSYSFIRATQPVFAWTPAGPNLALSSKALGHEVDGRLEYLMQENLAGMLRGGIFFPGQAAQYLINGSDRWNDPAIELRATIEYKF
jgi:hypothetical protein